MSGLQWFRLYHRIVDDEKLRLLAFEDRWHFVALCCLKADGLIDTPNDNLRSRKIAVKLGVQLRELDEIGRRLQEVDLVDENLSPVAWDELQYKSDNSTNRVKKYREKQQRNAMKRERNVSVTGQETDTDTDTEVNTDVLTAKRSRVLAFKPDGFPDQLWKDWKNHRKAAFTETALKGIQREAALAGWTLEAAITEAIERGWQGFKSEWVKEQRNGQKPDSAGISERAARQALHEISGGTGSFESGAGQISTGNATGNYHALSAVPDAMRPIGYAGSGTDSLV
jgi:hypothetical protein